jgi:uncharacterized protein YqgV (UPF0045/DUF77 family)
MAVTAQFSLYPLRTGSIGPAIESALAAVQSCDVSARVGRMSTRLDGSEEQIFTALRAAFRAAAERGDAVLVATVSNACKLDG